LSTNKPARIALDAMGGDFSPGEVVKGAVEAARLGGVEIKLVGPTATVQAELAKYNAAGLPITCVEANEVIMEGEPPAVVFRQKRNATIIVATKLVKAGEADAVIGAGPTGAVVTSALMILGLAQGIDRPVLGGHICGFSPKTVVLDCGGTIDAKPAHLLNFAIIGTVYARKILNVENPTVAVLSVGAEEGKGNALVKETYPLLKGAGLNFIGNVEGNDLVTGKANVVVCDGFVGNIVLKFGEALGTSTIDWMKKKLQGKIPAADLEKMAEEYYGITNTFDDAGGGPMFGVNGISMVMHGRSKAHHFTKAITFAKTLVESGLINSVNSELERIGNK
jgi:phosphate acyltransferase